MWWLVAWTGLARAECDNGALADALALARERYAAVDEAAFRAAISRAEATFACMREPIWRPTVAEWHRTTALLVAVDGGEGSRERVVSGLRAGLEIDPTLSIFPGALPENFWVARYDEARALPLGADLPVVGPVVVDGQPGGARRVGLPAVVQCLDDGGGVQWTHLVGADEPVPTCAPKAARVEATPVGPSCEGRFSPGATWLTLGGTAVAAGASAGLYLWNADARERYAGFAVGDSLDAHTRTWHEVNRTGAGFVAATALTAGLSVPLALNACF